MSRYARFEINLILFLGAALTTLSAAACGWWAMLPALLILMLVSFYRDPPRRPPRRANVLVAPADGRVIDVQRGLTDEDGQPMLRVRIFLSLFDVHVNRSPCLGRVLSVERRPGRFVSALRRDAGDVNESVLVTIAPHVPIPGPVRVRQIAGRLARRIVCAVAPRERLRLGQRIGMIKLGSQTELSAPDDPRWNIRVRPGQHLRAGETIVAELGDVAAPGDVAALGDVAKQGDASDAPGHARARQ